MKLAFLIVFFLVVGIYCSDELNREKRQSGRYQKRPPVSSQRRPTPKLPPRQVYRTKRPVYSPPSPKTTTTTQTPPHRRLPPPSPAKRPVSTPSDYGKRVIPGTPVKDYPMYSNTPRTSFGCNGKIPGYYADVEARCQMYHVCKLNNAKFSFLCPAGTVFDQKEFACNWWNKVNCNDSPKYYTNNANIGKKPNVPRQYS